jgi:peroxiredoxin (alkyl hydroperoxide reductase subunit C)
MVLVNKLAPDFSAKAVVDKSIVENFRLSDFRGKKYVVLFFYPLDFTFVCPTELHAFQEKLEEFKQRNVEVIGVSTDSWFSHLAWLNVPRKEGGIEGVSYPLVSDFTKKIARDYDVLIEEEGVALRGLFLIDKSGIVQHQLVNNLPLGRSVDEVLRLVDALQFTEKHGEVCPANWQKGAKSMKPNEAGLKEFFTKS